MASSKVLAASFVLMLFTFNIAQAQSPVGGDAAAPPSPPVSPPPLLDCMAECRGRCRKTRRPIRCKRKCNSCCVWSLAGYYDPCLCYANPTTKDIVRKCPWE